MKYAIKYTNRFKKEYKRCIKRGYNPQLLSNALQILAYTGKLPPKYNPHLLHGDFEGYWECHIQPDWLLIWRQIDNELILILTATGTHSDLFGKTRR